MDSRAPHHPVARRPKNEGELTLQKQWFLATVCILAAIPTWKIGLIEPMEIFFLLHLIYLAARFAANSFRATAPEIWIRYGGPNLMFILLTIMMVLVNSQQRFFLVPGINDVLKRPIIISFARLLEYFLVSFYMLYVASILRTSRAAIIYVLKTHITVGLISCIYGLISIPVLLVSGLELGAYQPFYRVRGTLNEGGPFGLYLLSVMLCIFLARKMKVLSASRLYAYLAILMVGILLSQSKAAFTALFLIGIVGLLLIRSTALRIGIIATVSLLVVISTQTYILSAGFATYYSAAVDPRAGLNEGGSYGFGGRAAALVLVPRIIEAHPWSGIGLGNYQLVRNDPYYLRGIAPLRHWDYSGAALLVQTAELGLPLSLVFLLVVLLPLFYTFKFRAGTLLKVTSCFQLVAILNGTEVRFFYPWLYTAIVIALVHFSIPKSTAENLPKSRLRSDANPVK